jgi:hypothetical protein
VFFATESAETGGAIAGCARNTERIRVYKVARHSGVQPTASLPCTERALDAGLRRDHLSGRIDGFCCAGRFAYAGVLVNGGSGETDQVTVLFHAAAPGWQVVSRAYCNGGDIPAKIRRAACDSN